MSDSATVRVTGSLGLEETQDLVHKLEHKTSAIWSDERGAPKPDGKLSITTEVVLSVPASIVGGLITNCVTA